MNFGIKEVMVASKNRILNSEFGIEDVMVASKCQSSAAVAAEFWILSFGVY